MGILIGFLTNNRKIAIGQVRNWIKDVKKLDPATVYPLKLVMHVLRLVLIIVAQHNHHVKVIIRNGRRTVMIVLGLAVNQIIGVKKWGKIGSKRERACVGCCETCS